MTLGLLLFAQLARAIPVVSLEALLHQPIEARIRQLRALDARRLSELEKIAFDKEQSLETRWRAVTTMGRLDAGRFANALERALSSPEWFVRNAGLIATLGAERGIARAAAVKALDDPALMVRTQAVRNLIHLDAREAEPRLWRALSERRNFSPHGESLWIRAHVVEALAKFATSARANAFRGLLEDRDVRVHKWVVRGLEVSTGRRLTADGESVEAARRKWRAYLGDAMI